MPAFLRGLPLHPLVVHAVVVLIPLAVIGTILIVVWPAARRRFGWLVVAMAAIAAATVPLATSTGEGLQRHLSPSALIERHAELGDQLLPFALVTLVAVAAFQGIHALRERGATVAPAALRAVTAALTVLCVLSATATAVQVIRIGDAGARATWSKINDTQQTGQGG